ncbi:UNKNOWN [Stylonychia lemnae]|uniref:Transmembrane protein n=1 Tax=Stylonychia lemnae TaxID=5949 RepID=A0A078A1G0_STYLE|nr:UNKNOWN [Stylonychia lemnae]|eukprot:CDW75935.1 UNKNOWN [Stylonychia lemnae]
MDQSNQDEARQFQSNKLRNKNFNQIILKAFQSFYKSALLKIGLSLLSNKLNVMKVSKQYKNILKFGIMAAAFSFLYNFSRFLMRKLQIDIKEDYQVFISSLISGFALFLAESRDRKLLQIAIYPRAIEALYSLLKEQGVIKPIKHGEYITCVLAMILLVYLYLFEPYCVGEGYAKNLDYYSGVTKDELKLFTMGRVISKNMIRENYQNNNLLTV